MKSVKNLFIATLITGLYGCGGGGGGGTGASSSSATLDAQGYWSGPSSTGYTVNAAVLENGEAWGIYSSGATIYGALYGSTVVNGNNVTISGTDFNFTNNSSAAGTLTGPATTKSTMSLSGSGVTVSLSYQSAYDTAATSAAITGTWAFIGRSKAYSLVPGSITVDGSGNFTLNQANCVTSGSIVPRAGGKNIYNVSLSSTGNGCAAGQSSLSGVAYLDATVTPNKFLSLALTSNKSDGVIVIGTRQ